MRLGLRVFFGFFLIAGLSSIILLRVVLGEVKPSVREVMEDIMVDTANLLAVLATDDLAALPAGGALDNTRFAQRVREYARRPVDVHIWGLRKQTLDFRIYVTDPAGRVVFDTVQGQGSAVGRDYSRWNDVARTLRGDYGARSTQDRYGGEVSPVMYVAAPVRSSQGQLLGVVTVAKPVATVQRFIDRAERRIWAAGLGLLAVSLGIGVAVTLWVVGHVRRLRRYAQEVQMGERQAPPRVPGELGELAMAMDAMRERLDGRERMEHLARALTHELKSPLAALRGAGELLQDDLAPVDRQRFAAQVVSQSERMTELVERLLELSALELRRGPQHPRAVRVDEVVEQALAEAGDRLQQRGLQVHWQRRDALMQQAEPELLALALSNLLANAVDFSPAGGRLDVSVGLDAASGSTGGPGRGWFEVRDHGPGVPPAAFAQLGQRFFSTARPGSLRKGSGLGLAIVRQIAGLHGWTLSFSPADPGLRVRLDFPADFTKASQTSP